MTETKYKKIYGIVSNNKIFFLSIVIGCMTLLPFVFFYVKAFFVMMTLLAINYFLSRSLRFMRRLSYPIEIVLFSTVIITYVFGFTTGAIFGAISLFVNFAARKRMSLYFVGLMSCHVLIAFIVSFMRSMDIVQVGLICIIIYNIISDAIVCFGFGGKIYKAAIWSLINVPFNIFLFRHLGMFFVRLLG